MELELVCVGADGTPLAVLVSVPPAATVGELRRALGSAGPLHLGPTPLPDAAPVDAAGIVQGATLGLGHPVGLAGESGGWELAVVGGLYGGLACEVRPGAEVVVGRGGGADLSVPDPEVSRAHAAVRVGEDGICLVDKGSRNGVRFHGHRLEGAAAIGDGTPAGLGCTVVQARRRPAPDADVSADGGVLRFNRPPRIVPPPPAGELLVPVPPGRPTAFRLPWISVLVPLLLGGVLYLVMRSPAYLLLTVLSPVLAIGNLVGDRRSGRKDYAAKLRAYESALAAFEAALHAHVAQEQYRCRQQQPDPGWLAALAAAPGARLWERRRGDEDFLRLRVGLRDRQARLVLRFDPRTPAPPTAELPEPPTCHDVPTAVPVREAGVVGLAGPRATVLAAGRALLTQAATLHAPADLGIVLITGDEAAWEWLTWLPHTRPPGLPLAAPRAVATSPGQAEARLAELRRLVEARAAQRRSTLRSGPPPAPEIVLVLDGARQLRGLPGLADLLAAGPEHGVYALCLDAEETALPDECRATIVSTDGTRAEVRLPNAVPIADVLLDGLTHAAAHTAAQALAPVRALGTAGGTGALPDTVRFTELAGLDLTDATLVGKCWDASPEGRSTRALLGVGPDGPLTVDLRRDGPHGLVAGTSGAGKSELLQTLVASLALANAPDALTFVLVDYKGGSAFAACAELPHCVGLITDLDGHLVTRALASLSAELRRRESLLAAAGAKDIEDYWVRTADRLPRLVIVVDEFASLVEEVPDFVPGVIGIGMRGRSLGVHVVLATQRPGGVVSADMRANLNLRISLRVTAESESTDVVDAPDAARITARQPGRAYLRTGHAELTGFQAARIGWPRVEGVNHDQSVMVRPRTVADLGRTPEVVPPTEQNPDLTTDLSLLVAAAKAEAGKRSLTSPRPPWLPPLPDLVTVAELPEPATRSPLAAPLGLADRPAAQSQDTFTLDLERTGPVCVAGASRTGRSTALRTLTAGLALGTGPDALHAYAVDCGNRALHPLRALPHLGAVVDLDEPDRLADLLDWLGAEVARRQRVLAAGGYGSLAEQRANTPAGDRLPYLLLVLDQLESFLRTFGERDSGRLVEVFGTLLRQGPAAGLAIVFSADRTGFPHRIAAAVEHRLVLRQADRDDVASFGLRPRDLPTGMPAGRAVWADGGIEVQIALLHPDPGAQAAAVREIGERLAARWDGLPAALRPRRLDPLPVEITAAEVERLRTAARTTPLTCTPAVGGHHLGPVDVDLADCDGTFVIAGPARSGRSTALVAAVRSLTGPVEVLAVAPRPSPLRDAGVRLVDPHELADVLAQAVHPLVLAVDDAERLTDPLLGDALEDFARSCRDTGSALLAAAATEDLLLNRFRGWLPQARRSRCGLLLNPASHLDGEVFELRLPRTLAGTWPPGRGLLVRRGETTLTQVPVTEGASFGGPSLGGPGA